MVNEGNIADHQSEGPAAAETPPPSFPVVVAPVSGLAPAQTISTPEHLDWHMIQDHELTQLSSVESGIIASLGFTGLGAAIGLIGPFLSALEKVEASPPQPITAAEVSYLIGFSGTVVLGVLCLLIHGVASWRKKGLADTIRARPKLGMSPEQ